MAVTIKQEVVDFPNNNVIVDIIEWKNVKLEHLSQDKVVDRELKVVLKRLNIPESCQNQTTFDLKKFNFLEGRSNSKFGTNKVDAQKQRKFCKICKIHFDSNSGFMRHRASHRKKSTFKSKELFENPNSFQSSVKGLYNATSFNPLIPQNIKTFQCNLCKIEIYSEEWFIWHMTNHQKSMLYCSFCGIFFDSVISLNSHFATHDSLNVYECDVCGKLIKWKYRLESHLLVHFPGKKWNCDTPRESFRNEVDFESNTRYVHNKRFKCSACGEWFTGLSELKNHRRSHKKTKVSKNTLPEGVSQAPLVLENTTTLSYFLGCKLCKIDIFSEEWYIEHIAKHEKNMLYCPEGCQFFDSKEDLEAHVQTHSLLKLHKCDVCEKTFKFRYNVENHMKAHFPIECHICKFCKKRCINKVSLNVHVSNVHKRKYECVKCRKSFSVKRHKCCKKENSLESGAKKNNEKNTTRFRCQLCRVDIFSEDWYHKHEFRHAENPLYCPQGCQFFDTQSELDSHVVTHKTLGYTCDVCEKFCRNRLLLTNHLALHFPEESHVCDICRKIFRTESLLKLHLRRAHDKKYKCLICDKIFYSASKVKEHIAFHQGKVKKPKRRSQLRGNDTIILDVPDGEKPSNPSLSKGVNFWCSKCDFGIADKESYIEHVAKHSLNLFECPRCHIIYNTRSGLKIHFASHINSCRFKCEKCGKIFVRSQGLKDHLALHQSEKRYVCDICETSYTSEKAFHKHVSKKHDFLRHFKCKVCNGALGSFSQFRTHMLTHQSEKEFLCHICFKCFDKPFTLKKHVMAHSEKKASVYSFNMDHTYCRQTPEEGASQDYQTDLPQNARDCGNVIELDLE